MGRLQPDSGGAGSSAWRNSRSQLWLTFSLTSRHFHAERSYNESNPGAGLELKVGRWSIVFGAYKNSLSVGNLFRRTMYGGIEYKPLSTSFNQLAAKNPQLTELASKAAADMKMDLTAPDVRIRSGWGLGYMTGYINSLPRLPLPVIIRSYDFEQGDIGFNVLTLPRIPFFTPLTYGFRGKLRLDDHSLPQWARRALRREPDCL
jgi:hypothetical protein